MGVGWGRILIIKSESSIDEIAVNPIGDDQNDCRYKKKENETHGYLGKELDTGADFGLLIDLQNNVKLSAVKSDFLGRCISSLICPKSD